MSVFYGKVCFALAGGILSGDLLGILIGFMFGTILDIWLTNAVKEQQKIEEWLHDFSFAVTSLHGHIAKLDGKVTPEEIKMFRRHMEISERDEESIGYIFNSARRGEISIDRQLKRLGDLAVHNKETLQTVLLTLYRVAMCDGGVKPAQLSFLKKAIRLWGLNVSQVQKVEAQSGFRMASEGKSGFKSDAKVSPSSSLKKYYKVLGVKDGTSRSQIKKKYRELIRKHHPDRVRGAGGSEKDVQKAEDMIAEINVAYDMVMDS